MSRQGPFRRFVVGLDGSEDAARALEFAIRLARATRAEIVAVHALEAAAHLTHAGLYGRRAVEPGLEPGRVEQAREFVELWCRPLADSGVEHQTIAEPGAPALVIAGLAERLDADLVVVGRRGRGTLAELVLGSVSRQLTHHCACPVMIVSPDLRLPSSHRGVGRRERSRPGRQ
jgi:nucleotide-binding universal stress UspA family protein